MPNRAIRGLPVAPCVLPSLSCHLFCTPDYRIVLSFFCHAPTAPSSLTLPCRPSGRGSHSSAALTVLPVRFVWDALISGVVFSLLGSLFRSVMLLLPSQFLGRSDPPRPRRPCDQFFYLPPPSFVRRIDDLVVHLFYVTIGPPDMRLSVLPQVLLLNAPISWYRCSFNQVHCLLSRFFLKETPFTSPCLNAASCQILL